MAILIEDMLVDERLPTTRFCCDLSLCLGLCCAVGEVGAPLTLQEARALEALAPSIAPLLPERNRRALLRHGPWEIHFGQPTTSLIGHEGPCVWALWTENRWRCSLELLPRSRGTSPRPLSCRLFPLRIHEKDGLIRLRLETYEECRSAFGHGEPLHRFLRDPLIEALGERRYASLSKRMESLAALR
jgi:hypothetical protein